MNYEDTLERCLICRKDFTKKTCSYPWKAQKKWVTHYSCPYCKAIVEVVKYAQQFGQR
ncbi:MAG: hypothetical protein J6O18_00205 [Bacilli bacterium]|nr:hypothetical protein [Bacilli bacterium]